MQRQSHSKSIQFNYPIAFIWLRIVDIEMKRYKKTKTAEVKFMRHTTGYSLLDHRGN